MDDFDYPPIQDYAIVGDGSSTALISRQGAVEWLCWPVFNSPSIFAAMLDRERGGRFVIRPVQPFTVARQYLEDTNVLETTFTTDTGVLRLVDLMPIGHMGTEGRDLWPDHELLRMLTCQEGHVDVEVTCAPRPDYGRDVPRFSDRGKMGFFYNYRRFVLALRSDMDLALTSDRSTLQGRCTLREGESRTVALTFEEMEPAVLPLLGEAATTRLERTVDYWRAWIGQCEYDGPFEEMVKRSLLVLKLMTYAPSGAIIAAPTTSLPEHIGGERNWDYRFCWLRDASFTVRALFELGYQREGEAFFSWLMHVIGGTQMQLNVMYDVYGGTHLEEKTLDHLEGYKGSRPVRIGNSARNQFQLDMYGEVVSAAFEYAEHNETFRSAQQKLLRRLGNTVCERWDEPDDGIWEKRSSPKHHTYSKAMCWVALERLLRLHERGYLDVPVEKYEAVQHAIRERIEERGFNTSMESYTATFDGDDLDASLLLLPTYGYKDANDDRMRSTFARIEERLTEGSLMYRYPRDEDDGLEGGEGAFGICSFWDETYLAQTGRVEEAKEHFEAMMDYANDVGLFAEEIDPDTGDALGNFPQAFTHVGLINAAYFIAEAEREQQQAPVST